ncbi:PAP2 superfamily protein [Rhodovulum kholense]|uniref:PAP2 superfamily protein n=2 Tax=Rhodovulum kholense TaxID=453584 RepID=A0A8E2VJG2_9RHOB|nr:PAP2 superfamily protein [Rhodovulum kholense]
MPETDLFAMRVPPPSFLIRPAALSAMLALVLLSAALSEGRARRIGDHLQIALPAAGLVCAATRGQARVYAGRYLLLEAGIKFPKALLGDLPVNLRPNGGGHGFPSGHTAAAAFGASALVAGCLRDSPGAQAVAVMSAGFVGASRIDAGRHTIWQTLAGAVLGWLVATVKLIAFDRAVVAIWARAGARLTALRGRAPVPGRP